MTSNNKEISFFILEGDNHIKARFLSKARPKNSLRSSAKEMQMHWETYRSWIYGMKIPCQVKKDREFGIIPADYIELKQQYDFLPNVTI